MTPADDQLAKTKGGERLDNSARGGERRGHAPNHPREEVPPFLGVELRILTRVCRLFQRLVAGEKVQLDPKVYRFARFSDGSKLTLRAGF